MDKLILEDVRCFHGRHELPLAPLTILIGENSTGKSTLLAATRLAWDVSTGLIEPDFNEEPFDWGAYDQIAHFRGGRGGRAATFAIGFEQLVKRPAEQKVWIEATFAQWETQPHVLQWQVQSEQFSITAKHHLDADKVTIVLKAGRRRSTVTYEHVEFGSYGSGSGIDYVILVSMAIREAKSLDRKDTHELEFLSSALHGGSRPRPYAIAPIRTKPKRTYDRRREAPRPEGDHVPMILARTKSSDPKQWKELTASLREFGSQSGLFKSVNVKRLGRKESDPFQVQIGIAGPSTNLMDVGYGVSQILPIAVDCLMADPGQMLLMQQPEVHLHPRAQAELGSFLGYLVKERKNRFMIETHSDYLIDRIRLDIRDGKFLGPDDVSLLYCERKGVGVDVHHIQIDDDGNLVNPPPGYRRFFLEEEKRFFEG